MIENNKLFEDLQRLAAGHVLCIGDVMMDRFVYGGVERISPEAPIPVFLVSREKHMLGGAGNVVANVKALGGNAVLLAVVGDDINGREVKAQLEMQGIGAALEIAADRFTTVKSRFVSGGQQMLRVDREKTQAIPADVETKILQTAEKAMQTAGAVILSDYGKGMLTDRVIQGVIDMANRLGKPVIVDPKGRDFSRYRGATIVTPNRKELETATGMIAGTDDEVRAAAMKVMMECGITAVMATRSQDGMSVITSDADPRHIPANVREVFDVSGAGDTVVATFALALSAGVGMEHAAQLANIAAGIVVGKTGTATARPDEMLQVLEDQSAAQKQNKSYTGAKCVSIAAAGEQAERWRIKGGKVGFTNGCFDLLHPGHVSTLQQAKAACDYLVVAINSDSSVKRLKGESRPVQDQNARAAILSALACVDLVVVFEEDTPIEAMKAIRPDILVKGGQYKLEEVVGYDLIASWGGKVVRADMEDGFSTTNTIAKMAG